VDINEDELAVHKPKMEAAGVKAVMVALERAVAQAEVTARRSPCCG
jgi:formate dehydrogenase major subunit